MTDTNVTSQGSYTFKLAVTNAGFSTLNLADVTLRYWFTSDGNAVSGMVFVCDYAANASNMVITPNVTGTFMSAPAANVTATADSYLEIAFGPTTGMLGGLGGSGMPATIQVRLHGGPSTNPYMDLFNETNDYSWDGTKTTSQPTQTITAYVQGQLVWGCEPGSGGSGSSSGGSSGGADSGGGVDAAAASDAAGQ
jgi:hypothetical protein